MNTVTIANTSQYLSFNLGEEIFALDISKVREVLDNTKVTKVPKVPDYMLGVINLRGKVVPIIDLKMKFSMPLTEQTVNTCIIISDVSLNKESITLGIMSDSVQEVFDLDAESIEPAPSIGTQLDIDFLTGMGKRGEDFILILDIDRVFSKSEKKEIKRVGDEAHAGKQEGAEIEIG